MLGAIDRERAAECRTFITSSQDVVQAEMGDEEHTSQLRAACMSSKQAHTVCAQLGARVRSVQEVLQQRGDVRPFALLVRSSTFGAVGECSDDRLSDLYVRRGVARALATER